MHKKGMGLVVLPMIIFLLSIVFGASTAVAALKTFVSIGPQQWLVQKIGGDNVEVEILVGEGQDPHTFEPTPKQVERLSRATLWFTMKMEFEEQLKKNVHSVAPTLRIVDMSRGVKRILFEGSSHEHHDKEHHAEHDAHGSKHHDERDAHDKEHHAEHDAHGSEHHDESDPHIWLSPVNLKIMADEVERILSIADPAHKGEFVKRKKQVQQELQLMHEEITTQLAPYKGASFYVYHPSFGYFAEAYGLQQLAVEVEGKSPSPRQLAKLIAQARREKVHVIFVQPQFESKSGTALADAIDGKVVPLDALATDVAGNIRKMADKVEAALSQ